MKRTFALLLVSLSAFAADVAAPAAPNPILSFLSSGSTIAGIVATVFAVVFGFWKLADVRKKQLSIVFHHAYLAVADLAATTEGEDALDKVAAGLKAADEYAVANGWRALSEAEKARAKLSFSAQHGAEVLATKIATAAAVAGAPVAPTVPPTPLGG